MPSLALIISFFILIKYYLHVHGQTSSEINATEIFLIDEEILDRLREDTVTKLQHDESGQCIFVKSEEGLYSYSSPGGYKEVCGLYIIADPSEVAVFEFEEFDISCENDGLASMVDGWELNGQFFPTTKDHPMSREERFMEYCGEKKPEREFRMSQNVGLIEFRIPIQNEGFKVNVTFHKNSEPCNAILQNPQGVYTIRNHGKRLNCSVSIMFPESFQVISSDVGVKLKEKILSENETSPLFGLTRECREGASDYVEIIGGDGLDTAIMRVAEAFCGIDNKPGKLKVDIACGNTAVRMVSSGNYENSVTIAFDLMTHKYKSSSLVCPAFLESL